MNKNYSGPISYKHQLNGNNLLVEDFSPRMEATIRNIADANKEKRIFFLQRGCEQIEIGKLYSHIFYSPNIEFYERPFHLEENLSISYGSDLNSSSAVKELAISHNENETIFPNSMLESFRKNTSLLDSSALSVQVFSGDNLIGHISALKVSDDIFSGENHYCLLRFIVHRDHRQTGGIKEFLISELKKYLPKNSTLTFQVFPHNTNAQRFFSRRMNAVPYYQKWLVE